MGKRARSASTSGTNQMSKYRSGHDAPKRASSKPDAPAGGVPDGKLGVFDHKGNRLAHVGRTASSATVSRFTGTHENTLTKKDGRDAWVAAAPKPTNQPPQNGKRAGQLRQAKGSVSKTIAEWSAMGATDFKQGG